MISCFFLELNSFVKKVSYLLNNLYEWRVNIFFCMRKVLFSNYLCLNIKFKFNYFEIFWFF